MDKNNTGTSSTKATNAQALVPVPVQLPVMGVKVEESKNNDAELGTTMKDKETVLDNNMTATAAQVQIIKINLILYYLLLLIVARAIMSAVVFMH